MGLTEGIGYSREDESIVGIEDNDEHRYEEEYLLYKTSKNKQQDIERAIESFGYSSKEPTGIITNYSFKNGGCLDILITVDNNEIILSLDCIPQELKNKLLKIIEE